MKQSIAGATLACLAVGADGFVVPPRTSLTVESTNVLAAGLFDSQPATVSPTSTEEFKQLLEAIRENHASALPVHDAELLGNNPQLADYVKTKAPEYAEYIRQGQLAADLKKVDISAFQDKFQSLDPKAWNLGEAFSMGKLSALFHADQVSASWGDLMASLVAVKSALEQGQFGEIGAALNFKETGAWYLAASVVALGVKSAASEAKAKTAPKPRAIDVDAIMSQVNMLRSSTDAVNAQLNNLKSQKLSDDDELAIMRAQFSDVRVKLEQSIAHENELRQSLEATQKELTREAGDLRAELKKCALVEQDLRDRLAATESELAKERRKLKKAQKTAKEEIAAALEQVARLEEEKMEMEAEITMLKSQVISLKAEVAGQPVEPDDAKVLVTAGMPSLEDDMYSSGVEAKAASPRKTRGATRAAKSRPTLPTTVSSNEMLSDLSDAFFMDISEPVKKRKVVRKVLKKKKAAPVANGAGDWSALSMSALKRKTVKDLTGYLEAKGETTTDPSTGKTLRKDALVEIVMAR